MPRPAFEGGPGHNGRSRKILRDVVSAESLNRPRFASPVLPRFCTSWRQPSQPLGPTEEGTALPNVQPVSTLTPTPRVPPFVCALVRPHVPNPHHPRPWRRGSVFGDGPRRPLSADERRIWAARIKAERRAGRLTLMHVEVGEALLRRLGEDGRCDPSHATLAEDAGCNPSTVLRALKALQRVGLLTWERRVVRCAWPEGGHGATRAEQISNAYELRLPDHPVAPREERRLRAEQAAAPATRVPDCNRHYGGENPYQFILRELPELTEIERKRLEGIKQARRAQLDAEWQARRAERWSMRS